MKKLLSIILFLVLCLSFCFCFVGCGDIFAGNYKLVASEELDTILEGIDFDINYMHFSGLYLNFGVKLYPDKQYSKAVLKYNKSDEKLTYEEESSLKNQSLLVKQKKEVYIDDEYYYVKTSDFDNDINEEEKKIKINNMYTYTAEFFIGYVRHFLDFEEYGDILDLDVNKIKELNAKVYIDKRDDVKIKIAYETEFDLSFKGEIWYVFDSSLTFKGMKANTTMYNDNLTIKGFMKLTEYFGKVIIPTYAKRWKEANL